MTSTAYSSHQAQATFLNLGRSPLLLYCPNCMQAPYFSLPTLSHPCKSLSSPFPLLPQSSFLPSRITRGPRLDAFLSLAGFASHQHISVEHASIYAQWATSLGCNALDLSMCALQLHVTVCRRNSCPSSLVCISNTLTKLS